MLKVQLQHCCEICCCNCTSTKKGKLYIYNEGKNAFYNLAKDKAAG